MTAVWNYDADLFSDVRVVIEDDGRVCYAYLVHTDRILGDVWLYNHADTPDEPEWEMSDARERMPFLNPRAFCGAKRESVIKSGAEISVGWSSTPSGEPVARIHRDGDLWAVLVPGASPGWSRLATRSGPLARTLAECEHLEPSA